MKITPALEQELEIRLESPTGANQAGEEPAEAELAQLVALANRLRAIPPARPTAAWLADSRQRLLARFAARYQSGQTTPLPARRS